VGDALLAAYIRAGKNTEGIALAKDELQAARLALPAESLVLPEMLAKYGTALSALKAWPDAEQVLREWLALCELREPDAWTTFNARSILGEALLGQKKYADAEPLLLTGYEGMKQRAAKIPPQRKPRLTEALQRLVKLYVATGETEQASKWRKELETLQAGLLLPISEKP
jgi:TolA-binding protein